MSNEFPELTTAALSEVDRVKAENAKLREALTEECDVIERGGSRTYWGLTNPAILERLDRLNTLLGRPRHETMKS